MITINFVLVFLAALAAFIIGFLAHGPVFGKLWMRLANIHPTGNEKLSDMIPQMLLNLLVNVVSAYMLAVVYAFASHSPYMSAGTVSGIICGLLMWIGFNVTVTSIDVLWMGKSAKLWLYECACSLLIFAVMGAIVAQ